MVIFSYVTLYSNWFEVPSTIPFTAFSFALLLGYLPIQKPFSWAFHKYVMGGLGILLIYASFTNLKIAYAYNSNSQFIIARRLDFIFGECDNCSVDQNRGGAHLAVEVKNILSQFDKNKTPENAMHFIKVMIEVGDYEKPSVELMINHLGGLSVLLNDPAFCQHPLYPHWREDQAQLMAKIRTRLPYRGDLLISNDIHFLTP